MGKFKWTTEKEKIEMQEENNNKAKINNDIDVIIESLIFVVQKLLNKEELTEKESKSIASTFEKYSKTLK